MSLRATGQTEGSQLRDCQKLQERPHLLVVPVYSVPLGYERKRTDMRDTNKEVVSGFH